MGLWIDVCFSKGDACAFSMPFAGCWGVDPFMMIGKRGWAKKKGDQSSLNFLPRLYFPVVI